MIDSVAAVKNNAGEIRQYKAVLAKILGRHSNHFNEGPKSTLILNLVANSAKGERSPGSGLGWETRMLRILPLGLGVSAMQDKVGKKGQW